MKRLQSRLPNDGSRGQCDMSIPVEAAKLQETVAHTHKVVWFKPPKRKNNLLYSCGFIVEFGQWKHDTVDRQNPALVEKYGVSQYLYLANEPLRIPITFSEFSAPGALGSC